MKEIAEIRVPGITANDYEKNDAEFLDSIKNTLNRQINERLTQILKNNDELIIKKSQLGRNERFVEKNYYQIIYSYTLEHSPLVRCKDCNFSEEVDPGLYICHNENIKIVGTFIDPNWYCADGKERK